MQTLNNIQILGNIGSKAKMTEFPNGGKKTVLSVATNTGYGDNVRTQWHTVLLYNKSAVICSKLDKGDVIWCSGFIDYRKWEDEQSGVTRILPEIHVEKFRIIKGEPVNPNEGDVPEPQLGSYAGLKGNTENPSSDQPTSTKTPNKNDATPKNIPY